MRRKKRNRVSRIIHEDKNAPRRTSKGQGRHPEQGSKISWVEGQSEPISKEEKINGFRAVKDKPGHRHPGYLKAKAQRERFRQQFLIERFRQQLLTERECAIYACGQCICAECPEKSKHEGVCNCPCDDFTPTLECAYHHS
jgi:hypothetical protein